MPGFFIPEYTRSKPLWACVVCFAGYVIIILPLPWDTWLPHLEEMSVMGDDFI